MSLKIRILFDANPLVRQKTGVGYYTEGVIKALAAQPGTELIGHYFKGRGLVPELPKADNLSYSHNLWLVGQAVKALRKVGIRLPWELLARRKADVLFFPDFTAWPSLFRTPKVLTIHDLTYIDHPEYVTPKNLRFLRRYVKSDARKAKLVLTISDFSKQRIIKEFDLPASKIAVEPVPPPAPLASETPRLIKGDYLLFISTIEPRKNLILLLEAYKLLPTELKERYGLIIAGGQGWHSADTMKLLKRMQSEGEPVAWKGYVDESTRANLYKHATAVVVPSFYEGFGIPVLEAFSYKTPVIASDIPSFKEIAGRSALFFKSNSVQDLSKGLSQMMTDVSLRERYAKAGAAQLKKYSWDKIGKEIYEKIAALVD